MQNAMPEDGADGQLTDPSGAIVFDTSGGISLEEQREIAAGINAMAGGARLAPGAVVTGAKKKGFLFPLFVNISAALLLGIGFVLLAFFQRQDEQSIRDSSAVLGLTERKLIQEIRRETNLRISEKENEINGIRAKLSEADGEYRQLQVSVESLTEAQKERAAALLVMQEEYRDALSGLEEDKARIIEESREQEAALKTQADERAAALSSRLEEERARLGEALDELRLLSGGQERARRAESQMSGFYGTLNLRIGEGRLDEAAELLLTMKEFLDAPSLKGIAAFEAGKQTHLAAIAAVEEAVAEARRLKEEAAVTRNAVRENGAPETADGGEELAALEAEKEALEQRTDDLERIVALYEAEGSEQAGIIADFENRIKELEAGAGELSARNINQQETLNRRDTEVVALRAQVQAAREAASATETELRTQIEAAENHSGEITAELESLKAAHSALTRERDALKLENDEIREFAQRFLNSGE